MLEHENDEIQVKKYPASLVIASSVTGVQPETIEKASIGIIALIIIYFLVRFMRK